MKRQNVAYLISNNLDKPTNPTDPYLGYMKFLLETYYSPPLGNYTVVYVNTFREVIEDLIKRLKKDKQVGNIILVAHAAPESNPYRIRLPVISIPNPVMDRRGLDAIELKIELDKLTKSLKTAERKTFVDLIQHKFDEKSTLTLMVCIIGNDRRIADAFQSFLGGKLTVFAPKHYIGVVLRKLLPTSSTPLIDTLSNMGLINLTQDPLYKTIQKRTMLTELLQKLEKVKCVSDQGEKSIPLLVMKINGKQVYPQSQVVGADWSVSAPQETLQDGHAIQRRLFHVLPGGETLAPPPTPKLPKQLIQLRRPSTPTLIPRTGQSGLTPQINSRPSFFTRLRNFITGQGQSIIPHTHISSEILEIIQRDTTTVRRARERTLQQVFDHNREWHRDIVQPTQANIQQQMRRHVQQREAEAQRQREHADASLRHVREESDHRRQQEEAQHQRAQHERERRQEQEYQRRLAADRAARIPQVFMPRNRPEFWPKPTRQPLPGPIAGTMTIGPIEINRPLVKINIPGVWVVYRSELK